MKTQKISPEELLFTKHDGTQDHFYEVVSDELDYPEKYRDRIPCLIDLMNYGEPYHSLLSCIMLTSWGYAEGFKTLTEWAIYPEKTPWREEPVLRDRITGADSAYEKLADAIRTSYYGLESQESSSLRKTAIKALLKLFPTIFFDNALTFAISSNKTELLPDILENIHESIISSIDLLRKKERTSFNLQMQVASLLGTLRGFDEYTIIKYAKILAEEFPDDQQMFFELVSVLGGCKIPEALEILEKFYVNNADLKEYTLKAIERFKESQVI
jgi:hypothetical protein